MTRVSTEPESTQPQSETAGHLFDNWIDPLETEIHGRVRGFIEELIRSELDAALARPRYGRPAKSLNEADGVAGAAGHRHGSRSRTLMGTFGKVEIDVPRAGLQASDGKTSEWRSSALRAYQRRTLAADALIASAYLAGTNTRRVRRALAALFGGAVGKDTVSRVWRKVKSDWDAWNVRSLAAEPILRLILDGTVVRVRLDRKATAISLLVVLGVLAAAPDSPAAFLARWRAANVGAPMPARAPDLRAAPLTDLEGTIQSAAVVKRERFQRTYP